MLKLIECYICDSCNRLYSKKEFDSANKCCKCVYCGKENSKYSFRFDICCDECYDKKINKDEKEEEERCICDFHCRGYYSDDEICKKCQLNGFICTNKFSCK